MHYSSLADGLLADFQKIDRASVHSHDDRELRKGLLWIASQPKTVEERVSKMEELYVLGPGLVVIGSIRFFCGW